MAHTRHATVGGTSLSNAHPFEEPNLVGMHNGTITELGRTAEETDSQHLFSLVQEHGIKDAIVGLPYGGAYALSMYNKLNTNLEFIRNHQRGLSFGYNETSIWWMSDEKMMNRLNGMGEVFWTDIKELSVHDLLTIRVEDGKFVVRNAPNFANPRNEFGLGKSYSRTYGQQSKTHGVVHHQHRNAAGASNIVNLQNQHNNKLKTETKTSSVPPISYTGVLPIGTNHITEAYPGATNVSIEIGVTGEINVIETKRGRHTKRIFGPRHASFRDKLKNARLQAAYEKNCMFLTINRDGDIFYRYPVDIAGTMYPPRVVVGRVDTSNEFYDKWLDLYETLEKNWTEKPMNFKGWLIDVNSVNRILRYVPDKEAVGEPTEKKPQPTDDIAFYNTGFDVLEPHVAEYYITHHGCAMCGSDGSWTEELYWFDSDEYVCKDCCTEEFFRDYLGDKPLYLGKVTYTNDI